MQVWPDPVCDNVASYTRGAGTFALREVSRRWQRAVDRMFVTRHVSLRVSPRILGDVVDIHMRLAWPCPRFSARYARVWGTTMKTLPEYAVTAGDAGVLPPTDYRPGDSHERLWSSPRFTFAFWDTSTHRVRCVVVTFTDDDTPCESWALKWAYTKSGIVVLGVGVYT